MRTIGEMSNVILVGVRWRDGLLDLVLAPPGSLELPPRDVLLELLDVPDVRHEAVESPLASHSPADVGQLGLHEACLPLQQRLGPHPAHLPLTVVHLDLVLVRLDAVLDLVGRDGDAVAEN